MISVARWFFITAIIYGLLGMLLGLHMAMSHNHDQRPTHAHIMVIGWVSFFLFGLFYARFGTAVRQWLAVIHLVVAQLTMVGLMVGLWLLYSGETQYEPIAAISSIAYAASFLVFAIVAIPTVLSARE